jgi:uncharacterized protein (TIGR03086 family)
MDRVADRYLASLEDLDRHVEAIAPAQWHDPTPCSAWDVRALVDHLVYETLWVPDLVSGMTLAEVGSRHEGDRLGSDPPAAWRAAAGRATAAVPRADPGVAVHTSGGELDLDEYLTQMLFDATIHGWDLATAIGGPHAIEPEVASDLLSWFAPQAARWEAAGALAPPVPVHGDAPAGERLLALTGRDPSNPLG